MGSHIDRCMHVASKYTNITWIYVYTYAYKCIHAEVYMWLGLYLYPGLAWERPPEQGHARLHDNASAFLYKRVYSTMIQIYPKGSKVDAFGVVYYNPKRK